MGEEQIKRKADYSETFQVDNLEVENQALTNALNQLEQENKVINQTLRKTQEETAVLRDMFHKASSELENIRKPSLLVADVVNIIDDNKAIIKLPNGNKFYCYISKDVTELNAGDSALVEQKSLNILEKISVNDNFDVEKFVIIEKPNENLKDIGG